MELKDTQVPLTISKHLSLTETAATYVSRLRLINDEPIVVDEDYILKNMYLKFRLSKLKARYISILKMI
ncbi:hypothetical protein SDC49_05555 [Lactobacillus sp. R2/2]|nr:hypothetical protein [Lactobacillus sp. R2/2]